MKTSLILFSMFLAFASVTISSAQVPTQVSPDDSAYITELPVTLNWSWNGGQTVAQYQVQVDDRHFENTPFVSIEIDTVINSSEINASLVADQPALKLYFRYFWRVRANYENAEGQYEWSEWTEYSSFTLDCLGRCGDANSDGRVNLADVVYILKYVFSGGNPPRPRFTCGDSNRDKKVNVSDAVYLMGFIFSGGVSPGSCGGDWAEGACCNFVYLY